MKHTAIVILLLLGTSVFAQDSTKISLETKDSYRFKEGEKFEDTKIVHIKDAYVYFHNIDEKTILTVYYNPSSIFKRRGVVEYTIDSRSYVDKENGVYHSRGSKVTITKEGVFTESYLFIFDPNDGRLFIKNVTTGEIEFMFTGQEIPSISQMQRAVEEVDKLNAK